MSEFELSPEAQKYIAQGERKRQYNREYYHNKVKPKRESQKQELERLRVESSNLKAQLDEYSQNTLHPQIHQLQMELEQYQRQVEVLNQTVGQLQKENATLHNALEIARQRNYEILMSKADEILPNLTLNSS